MTAEFLNFRKNIKNSAVIKFRSGRYRKKNRSVYKKKKFPQQENYS
jgi:hypothetical protein